MKISVVELEKLVEAALTKLGYTPQEVDLISNVLMYAQLRGNNQGVVKLTGKGMPKHPQAGTITPIKDTPVSALLDGANNQGMLVLTHAMNLAISKAKKMGLAIVGTRNTSTSTGAIGYYAREIAKQDLIGFVFAGSPETVSPHGSYQPIFGTNPLAIGIPTSNQPLVLDMATAYMAYYGLIEAKIAGKSIPSDMAYDSQGNLTTDPAAAMDGAIRPFDKNYKGSGLAMMVEILTGPLVSASFTGIGDTSTNWGNLILAINPTLLVDSSTFSTQVSQLIDTVKHTQKLPGVEEILVPGERGDRQAEQAQSTGEIDIEPNLLAQLQQAAA
jgi:LDH2 family malate/lactate/ureidoglycolate dehydrogenase